MISYTNNDASTPEHPLPSELNWIHYWCLIHIHYLHQKLTHPSLPKWIESHIFSFTFESLFSSPTPRKYRTYYYLINTFTNTSTMKKLAFYVISSLTFTQKPYKPWLNKYKNLRVLFSLMSTVNTNVIQQTCLPPIRHLVISINLHISTRQPIKTHHKSRPSF